MYNAERRGKSAALNRAIPLAKNEILIMSDANTFLNREVVRYIVSHYSSPLVGGVAGEKKVLSSNDTEDVGSREGLYWKYESFLKRIDSDFYSVVGAAGELFSIRKTLYEPLPDSAILDDFIISLKAAKKGYRIIYEPNAYAMELSSASVKEEKKRKIRIAAGGFQAMYMLYPLLFFWKHFRLSYLYISHRVLRWTLSPLCLVLAFISNAVLAFGIKNYIYITLFTIQVIFYFSAFISKFIPAHSRLKFLKIAGYFSFMNFSVFLGFFRFISKKQSSIWEKSKRSAEASAPELK
jgi:cellulose synthase/poly-beta-1,6-N-acetylglucosamine synthase-like glycosyltransferase